MESIQKGIQDSEDIVMRSYGQEWIVCGIRPYRFPWALPIGHPLSVPQRAGQLR